MVKHLPTQSQAGLKNGIWMIHRDEQNEIHIWMSALSGKEEIYLNGVLVSSKQSIGRETLHEVVDSMGNVYEITYKMTEIRKASATCTITKNKEVVRVFKTRYERKKNFVVMLLAVMVTSVGFIYLKDYFGWPPYSFFIFLTLQFLMLIAGFNKGKIMLEEYR